MKKYIYAILFFLGLFIILLNIGFILVPKGATSNFTQFYKEDKPIDVVFVGPSSVFLNISPMYIWNKYGVVSYNRGTLSQSYVLTYTLLEEALKKKHPKLVIIDISLIAILENYKNINYATMNSLDSLIDRYKTVKLYNIGLSNLNIFNLYHNRIDNITREDFNPDSFYKGMRSDIVFHNNPQGDYVYNGEVVELDEKVKEYADKYVDLANKYGAEILFICGPKPNDRIKYYYSFGLYAKEKKYKFINYNTFYKDINIDFNKDFFDENHLTYDGGIKIIDHLLPYIINEYNIPVRKEDKLYKSWNDDYLKYERAVNGAKIKILNKLDKWEKNAFYDNYTIIISSSGNMMHQLDEGVKLFLKSHGLIKYDTNKNYMKYIAIIDDDEIYYEEISIDALVYKNRIRNKFNLFVKSDGESIIKVSGVDKSKNKYGLNIVVYDKINEEVVDSVWIDPKNSNIINRY